MAEVDELIGRVCSVEGSPGIAFRCVGYEEADTPNTWWDGFQQQTGRVLMKPIGVKYMFAADVSEIKVLGDDAYCHTCGQIGPSHDGDSE